MDLAPNTSVGAERVEESDKPSFSDGGRLDAVLEQVRHP